MTLIEIFNLYFKKKLFVFLGIGVFISLIVHFTKHNITLTSLLIAILIMTLLAFVTGYDEYIYYEKKLPKLISQLIDKPPLNEFILLYNFKKSDDNKITGLINGYNIALSPFANNFTEKYLIVIIALKLRDGLDDYFENGIDKNFKLHFSDNILTAESVLPDYVKLFDHLKLFEFLSIATQEFKDKNLIPLEIVGE